MTASNTLTDKAIRAAIKSAAAAGVVVRLTDGGGLRLDVQPSGSGWWRLRYRFAGKEGMLSLGTYPAVGLADARGRRDETRDLIAAGGDPSQHRKDEKQALKVKAKVDQAIAKGDAVPGSFEALARQWWATVHVAKVSPKYADRTMTRFEQDVFPWLGARPASEVEAPELLESLNRVVARGAIETAHRIKDACGQVFRFGIAKGECKRNPAGDLRDALTPAPTARHFAAITDPQAVGELLRAMIDYRGHPVTRAALQLSALLFQRPGQIRTMEWAWVNLDEATVTFPVGAYALKKKKTDMADAVPHIVALSTQAAAILRNDLHPLTGSGRYVFPGQLTATRPMSENTVRTALIRMGFRDQQTAHGFRAMARTILAERLEVPAEVIEAQLAHAVKDANGRAYNRTKFLAQRRKMMQEWADYLDELREGRKLIPMRRRNA
jgi:integrase